MHLVPAWRRQLRLGRRKEGMTRYKHSPGMPFLPHFNGGGCLPQVYCRAASQPNGEVFFTDDVLFAKHKSGLLQLLVYLKNLTDLPAAQEELSCIEEMSKGEIQAAEVTFLVEDMGPKEAAVAGKDMSSVFRLATAQEFALSPLCHGRPEPQFYDPYCLGNALEGNKYVIVRPDRFIFAACQDKKGLETAIAAAVEYLQE